MAAESHVADDLRQYSNGRLVSFLQRADRTRAQKRGQNSFGHRRRRPAAWYRGEAHGRNSKPARGGAPAEPRAHYTQPVRRGRAAYSGAGREIGSVVAWKPRRDGG